MSTTAVTNFVKTVVARLKGDDAEVLALKIERKANSALKGQLAALEAKVVDLENIVADKEEALNNAIYPSTLFTDNSAYIGSIQRAQAALDEAKDNLQHVMESIEYFTNLQSKF